MPLGTNNVVKSAVPNFIPSLWSDEVIASYKANIVVRNLVRVLNHRGKKGDTIKIPTPTRGTPSSKTANNQVTLIAHGTDTGITITINSWKEYSRLIEDIVDVQALDSLRAFYTDDGGYAIAQRVDKELILDMIAAGNGGGTTIVEDGTTGAIDSTSTFGSNLLIGDGSTAYSPTANANAGNATDLTDLGIRRMIKKLDDANAPMAGRSLLIPTAIKQDLLGFSRFTEQAFTGEAGSSNSIRNGLVGNVYAVDIYVTTNLPGVETGAGNNNNVAGIMLQRDAEVLVEQMGIRTQTQYKQEYLADLFTADMIYGMKTLRSTSIVPFVVPQTPTES